MHFPDCRPGMIMISKNSCLSSLLILLLTTGPLGVSAYPIRALETTEVCTSSGIVVSACPIASRVGADILGSGGTAADAAVAVGFARGDLSSRRQYRGRWIHVAPIEFGRL